jgi:rhomboid protease GluP
MRCERLLPSPALAPLMRALKLSELPATKILGALSVIVFALQFADASAVNKALFGDMPISTLVRFGALTTENGWSDPWRWLASCYIHLGFLHLGMNMMALADLGKQGEERVGSGFLVSTLWYGKAAYVTAGASGAIFGLMGLLLGERARRRDKAWKEMLVRSLIASVIYYYLLHTNQAAHLGGLCLGFAIGYFATHRITLRYPASLLSLAFAGVLLSVVSLVIPQMSSSWRLLRDREHEEELQQHFSTGDDDE